jgi:hypothetical protein
MGGWKRVTLILVLAAVIVGVILLVGRLYAPKPTEVERLFDGTESVFVEGTDLLKVWRALGRTEYVRSGTYAGLLELSFVREMIGAAGAPVGWADRVNLDAVMSAVGDESALGLYTGDRTTRLLFASRVDPNFLLVDRLLAFAGTDAGIAVTPYRGMRVKEAALGADGPLFWALDGDLLILSNDREVFYAAVDRHVSGTTGGIVSNRDFIRMKKDARPSRLISGYAVTGNSTTLPGTKTIAPAPAGVPVPGSFRFSVAYADGVIRIDARPGDRTGLFRLLPYAGTKALPRPAPIGDTVIAAFRAGGLPVPLKTQDGPFEEPPPPAELLPRLFPAGFSLFLADDPGCGGGPAMIAVGRRSAEWTATIGRLRETPGITERSETAGGLALSVIYAGAVPYLAWTEADGTIIVSDRADLPSAAVSEVLETGDDFVYNKRKGRITVTLRPRRMYHALERCEKPIPIPFLDLSLDDQKRLSTALYPALSIDGYASIDGSGLVIAIGVHVEDVIP